MNNTLNGGYDGRGRTLFSLVAINTILTLLTLGIYRFWAKTHVRRYFWSSAKMGEDRFEYHGTGLEKFVGFLIAVVVLAIYFGVIQLLLTFVGLSIFVPGDSPEARAAQSAVFTISIIATFPLIFYAIYQARRYMVSRTSWRGIRFGQDKGGWGFMWRALGHSVLSMITFGILIPRQIFKLEKFQTDRMYYGSAKFEQQGNWGALYLGLKHVFIAIVMFIIGVTATVIAFEGGSPAALQARPSFLQIGPAIGLLLISYIWFFLGFAYFRVYSFNYLTKNKTLSGGITFSSAARTRVLIWYYIRYVLCALGLMLVTAGLIWLLFNAELASFFESAEALGPNAFLIRSDAQSIAFAFSGLIFVVLIFILSVLVSVMITQPTIAHFVRKIEIHNTDQIDAIMQRAQDSSTEAGGFADALDIGGAV